MKPICNEDVDNQEQLDAAYDLVIEEARALDVNSMRVVNLTVSDATASVMSNFEKVQAVGAMVEEVLKAVNVSAIDKIGGYTLALRKADVLYQKAYADHVNGVIDDDQMDEATILRDRFFTLFIDTFAQIRRALCYLYWDTDKGDSILPPLFPQDDETRSYATETNAPNPRKDTFD
jgi:hypothetical protein